MSDGITRRRFIKTSAVAGASVTLGGGLFGESVSPVFGGEADPAGLAAVTSPDGFANTIAAVDALGGMARYVPKGSSVVINANVAFKHRGSIVHPDVLLATLVMCAQAGAREVWLLKGGKDGYWKRCERASDHQAVIDAAKASEREYQEVQIEKAVALRQAQVDKHLLSADVYLNLAIPKHHAGCEFTGALKNTMGACPHKPTCAFFHVGANPDPDSKDWYPDLNHLSQCIADVNLVRRPDLCILDAGEILTTNGPFGPGELAKPQAVVASADMVAIDSYSVRYLEMKHDAVTAIGMAAKHGLGTTALEAVGVHEVVLG